MTTAAGAGDRDDDQADGAPAVPDVQLIELECIDDSPSNPRKAFRELQELADDIRRHDVLQPVLVRPTGGRYALVFSAGRVRAARLAGVGAIPAMVRSMTDGEVLEPHLIENARRADIHPLDEADGSRVLHEPHGLAIEALAARTGKSTAYLYARLTLCARGPAGRAAVLDGRLSPSTALLITRIPDVTLQAEATEAITHPASTAASR